MKCGCGRPISRRLKGKCMACRYRAKTKEFIPKEPEIKTCPVCGKQFIPKISRNQVYCSQTCCNNVLVKKTCQICGEEFESKRSSSRKCCPGCSKVMAHTRKDGHPLTVADRMKRAKAKKKMEKIKASDMTYGQYMAHNGMPPQEPAELNGTLRPTEAWMEGTGQIRIGREGPPPKAWIKRL